jgi:hypothetical protein
VPVAALASGHDLERYVRAAAAFAAYGTDSQRRWVTRHSHRTRVRTW